MMPRATSAGRDAGDAATFAETRDDRPEHDERFDERHEPVRPFEDHAAVERRDQGAMAERPIRAREPGIVDADPAAEDGDGEGERRAGDGEPSEECHIV